MVDNLSPACRKLVDGIQDLLRYKEDAQLAEAILPELIKMLKCKCPDLIRLWSADVLCRTVHKTRVYYRDSWTGLGEISGGQFHSYVSK